MYECICGCGRCIKRWVVNDEQDLVWSSDMLGARSLVPILAEGTIVRSRERYRFLPVRTEVLESVGGEQRGDMRGRGHTRSQ